MRLTKPLLITKLKATGVHLLLSLSVFVYLAYQIYFNWYPQPYFSVDGGWQGIRLVAAVDLVLGPVITFLIFDLSKSRKEIVFDLITIVVIQFAALTYGVYLTYTQRPVAIVLIDDFVIPAIMEDYGGKLNSVGDLKQFSVEKPPIVYAHFPLDREAIDEIMRIKREDKVPEHAQLGLYRPQAEFKKALQARQIAFMSILDLRDDRSGFDAWLQQHQFAEDEVLLAPFSGRYDTVWLVFDLEGKYQAYFF